MFVVIFEVKPKPDRWDDYLALAKQLRPKLEAIDGFIDNERFESKRDKGRLLSLSTWRDEKSVVRWRTHGEHHDVQGKGRFEVFEDYHLRVGQVTSDTASSNAASAEPTRLDTTEIGAAKFCTITEASPSHETTSAAAFETLLEPDGSAAGLLDHELFESITSPGKLLMLASWRDDPIATNSHAEHVAGVSGIRHRQARVIRDYGMFDRREAPQFYPRVATAK
jgi:heme-degrading monooxygenase HmoA